MDKTWIKAQITSRTFKDGVKSFIDFARVTAIRGSIACPCYRCCNDKWFDTNTVHAHLLQFGFLPAYTTWTFHGERYEPSPLSQHSRVLETFPAQDDIRGLVQDALGVNSLHLNNEEERESRLEGHIGEASGFDPNTQQCDRGVQDIRYKKLLNDCEKELYPGCKYSTLSFTLHLYHIKCIGREESRKTQNSGVIVEVEGGNYYGKLTDIIELEYLGKYKVVLFRCDWIDIRPSRGIKKDRYGFPLVNFSRPLVHTGEALKDDPFIISSQARQVFYIEDPKDVGWSHVIMTKPRDTYDMGTNINTDDDIEGYTECIHYNLPMLDDVNEAPILHRADNDDDD